MINKKSLLLTITFFSLSNLPVFSMDGDQPEDDTDHKHIGVHKSLDLSEIQSPNDSSQIIIPSQPAALSLVEEDSSEEDRFVCELLSDFYQKMKPCEGPKKLMEAIVQQDKTPIERLEEEIEKRTTDRLQNITDSFKQELLFADKSIDVKRKKKPLLEGLDGSLSEVSYPQSAFPSVSHEDMVDTLYRVQGKKKKYASVLSLDGGGFRGLMQAHWLSHLESRDVTNRKLHQIFNVISGTSIGGILSLAATLPSEDGVTSAFSTKSMIDLFVKNGSQIFPQRGTHNYFGKFYDKIREIFHCRYDEKPLQTLLQSYFKSTRLSSALTNVVVTSAITDTHDAFLFNSFDNKTNGYMMWEVGRATSAAPSYFQVKQCIDFF